MSLMCATWYAKLTATLAAGGLQVDVILTVIMLIPRYDGQVCICLLIKHKVELTHMRFTCATPADGLVSHVSLVLHTFSIYLAVQEVNKEESVSCGCFNGTVEVTSFCLTSLVDLCSDYEK